MPAPYSAGKHKYHEPYPSKLLIFDNRFSQDIGILDSELPEALLDLVAGTQIVSLNASLHIKQISNS
jgi:hypothetical protein